MSDPNHQDDQFLIPDLANDAVMARSEAPQVAEVAFERFPELAGVTATRDVGIQIGEDAPLSFGTYFA